MGSLTSKAFIPPDEILGCAADAAGKLVCDAPFTGDWAWGAIQLLTLMGLYGYVLFYASNMLSEGSELLLLVPSISGIVGSVVLPILGAVPDGAIMLFSGLGPDAQEQLSVGVGALAGSTIMLLTIPWGAALHKGAVKLGKDGSAIYTGAAKHLDAEKSACAKASTHGVTPAPTIRTNGKIMVLTALVYLVIQGPAFPYARDPASEDPSKVAKVEHVFSLVGLILSVLAFLGYIALMVSQAGSSETQAHITETAIVRCLEEEGPVTLGGILSPIIEAGLKKSAESGGSGLSGELLDARQKAKLGRLLKPFFNKFDLDSDGSMDPYELKALLGKLGEDNSDEQTAIWMDKLDPDRAGSIEVYQFTDAMLSYIREKIRMKQVGQVDVAVRHPSRSIASPYRPPINAGEEAGAAASSPADEEEEEEEEEVPEDLRTLTPEEQQWHIKKRAATMMSVGTLLVILFSDPMVDCMSNLGERLGIPAFYVAFILAPLASNASELLASYNYAGKKTRKTITVALASLEGAACMNNTFCLAIFMALIYFKGLAWRFSAETLSILLVQFAVALVAMQRTQKVYHAFVVLALYPLAIAFVALLEGAGYD